MSHIKPPVLVPSEDLPAWFEANGIGFKAMDRLSLGFGHGNKQYQLYDYPGPADDETMGVFCEWHTENYFEVDSGPHIAIGMRGPVVDAPHRGRGIAIGILANRVESADVPGQMIPLFKGCPEPPGGPAFFIENFTLCDGIAPISDWQLSLGQPLPQLQGHGIFRIDIHVARGSVWAGVWKVEESQAEDGKTERAYTFLGQTSCSDEGPGFCAGHKPVCREDVADRGQGNAFIGSGFHDPETRSWVDNIYIAHWKNPG